MKRGNQEEVVHPSGESTELVGTVTLCFPVLISVDVVTNPLGQTESEVQCLKGVLVHAINDHATAKVVLWQTSEKIPPFSVRR